MRVHEAAATVLEGEGTGGAARQVRHSLSLQKFMAANHMPPLSRPPKDQLLVLSHLHGFAS